MNRPLHSLRPLLALSVLALGLVGCQSLPPAGPVTVKLIALNDFHGNFEMPGATSGGTVRVATADAPQGVPVRVGGAAFLSTLVQQLKARNPNHVVVGAGDLINASPAASALTHEEASIDILNEMGLEISSVGNHEFDHGKGELLRLQKGQACFPGGQIGKDTCLVDGKFPGARFQYLAANVVDKASGQTLLPATLVRQFGTVKVGFIGLTLKDTPMVVSAAGVVGLDFLDEVATIRRHAAELRAKDGAQAIVVLIHQGGETSARTIDDQRCPGLVGDIVPILDGLDRSVVDVVISGHTHREYVCRRNGLLVTSTGMYGAAVSDIDLTIEPGKGVTQLSAHNIPALNELNKTLPTGYSVLAKDARIDALVQRYAKLSAALTGKVVGSITADLRRSRYADSDARAAGDGGDSPLGNVMADVYLAAVPKAELAFINPGAIRADLAFKDGGRVTYGDLMTVAPFNDTLMGVDLTGAQIKRLLEQQWEGPNCSTKPGKYGCGRILQGSQGFTYAWDASKPEGLPVGQGDRVVAGSMKLNGQVMDMARTYRVALNHFMAPGPGDNFTLVQEARQIVNTQVRDIDALVEYMQAHPGLAPPAPRIQRLR